MILQSHINSFFGIKWNPFALETPSDSLLTSVRTDAFCWRVEKLVYEGGFALLTGDPGTGKSVTLRLIKSKLEKIPDVSVAALTRPQSSMGDFYRELGTLFQIETKPNNRWGSFKAFRERWIAHCVATRQRPVLIIDEAQEIPLNVANELRLLTSHDLDSRVILTVIIAGDNRLIEKLKSADLKPLDSRIRTRLKLEAMPKDELESLLRHSLDEVGQPKLMTDDLIHTVVDHAQGNPRALMILANELLIAGLKKQVAKLDTDLFFDFINVEKNVSKKLKR